MAFDFQVRCVPVEDVDVLGFHVDMGEEVLIHKAVVALWVITRDTDILVLIGSASLYITLL